MSNISSERLNVALIQTELVWHDPQANRQHFQQILQGINASDLIILPEMFTTGFTMHSDEQAEPQAAQTLTWLQQQARQMNTHITGSVSTQAGGCFNRLLLVAPDGSYHSYDKRHLFGMAGEHASYTAGKKRLIVDIAGWRICPMICYDLRFPVFSRNRLDASGQAEYDVLIYVANWPAKRRQHWRKLLQARAIENQCYCIGVNRIGSDGNQLEYAGDSLIIDPLGEILADAAGRDCVLQHSLDKTHLQQIREQLPFLRDADGFELR